MKVTKLYGPESKILLSETEIFQLLTSPETRVKFFQYLHPERKHSDRIIVALNMGRSGKWGPGRHTGLFVPLEKSIYIINSNEQELEKHLTNETQIWHRDADVICELFRFEENPRELVDLFIKNNYRLV